MSTTAQGRARSVASGAAVPTQRGRRTAVLHPRAVDTVATTLAAGGSVLVVGPPGSGKTHAVTQALAAAGAPADLHVVTVSGASARDGLPLSALEPLLDDTGHALGSFTATLDAFSSNLLRRAAGRAVVLRVEDAHLLDSGSARVVEWLVRQGELALVATLRTAAAAQQPWASLWKDDHVDRVDLAAPGPEAVEAWLTEELGGPVTTDTVHRLLGVSGGNAFHLREALHDARESGALVRRGGVWVWHGRARSGTRSIEIVEQELAQLSPAARETLEVCAVAAPVLLEAVLDVVTSEALDELVAAGAVTLGSVPGRNGASARVVDVAQGAWADAARSRTPASRQRELLARLLATPLLPGVAPASLVRSVNLALDLGLPVPAERFREAVACAYRLSRPDAVVDLTTSALTLPDLPLLERIGLLALRAEAHQAQSDHADADADLYEAYMLLQQCDRTDDQVVGLMLRVAELRAVVEQYHRGDTEAGLAHLDAVVAAADAARPDVAEPWWREEAAVARLTRLGFAGRFPEMLEEGRARLEGGTHPARRVSLASPVIYGLGAAGRVLEAAELCGRYTALATAQEHAHRWGPAEMQVASFFVLFWLGEIDVLRTLPRPTPGSEDDFAADRVTAHTDRGLCAVADGSWTTARAELTAANARLGLADLTGMARYTITVEAVAAAACGDAPGARELLERAERTPPGVSAVLEGDMRVRRLDALAWLRSDDLHEEALGLARWSRGRGAHGVELEALHRALDAARRSGRTPDPRLLERVRALGEVCQGPRAAALVAHAEALVGGDRDVLHITERELSRRGLWLPPVEPPVSLTNREREIALLAAGGMTSRAIAQRLTLSTRTVDSHLSRVFAKLGVHSREDLSTALR